MITFALACVAVLTLELWVWHLLRRGRRDRADDRWYEDFEREVLAPLRHVEQLRRMTEANKRIRDEFLAMAPAVNRAGLAARDFGDTIRQHLTWTGPPGR